MRLHGMSAAVKPRFPDLHAEPPQWAIDAGLPGPKRAEDFESYVARLGLDAGELLEELTERSAPVANVRLATSLANHLPDSYSQHVEALCARHFSPEQREAQRRLGRNLRL